MAVPRTTMIPYEMCLLALKSRHVRLLQLYVYLKFNCSGKIRLNKEFLEKVRIDLGLKSIRTITDCLKELQEKRWITYSNRSRFYFVKGFDEIRKLNGLYFKTSAEFCLDDIKKLKEFLTAVVIGSLINTQKRRAWAVELKKGSSKTPTYVRSSKYYPIANKALSDILEVSISTAFEMKKAAKKCGFISIKENHKVFTSINPNYSRLLKKYGDIPPHLIRYSKGELYLPGPDLVSSKIHFKSRKGIMNPIESLAILPNGP